MSSKTAADSKQSRIVDSPSRTHPQSSAVDREHLEPIATAARLAPGEGRARGATAGHQSRPGGVADPPRRGGRCGAPADRARPARLSPAAAGGRPDQARARLRGGQERAGERATDDRLDRTPDGRGARDVALARARHLPGCAARARPRRGAQVRGAALAGARYRSGSRTSAGTRARSRSPSTSAAWRRCRTSPSTPDGAEAVVRLWRDSRRLWFEVTDRGIGFDPDQVPHPNGLVNMRDRIEAVGGALTITSSEGRGATVRGWVPAT